MHQAMARGPRLPMTEERRRLAVGYLPLARKLAGPFRLAWPALRDEFASAAHLGLVEAAGAFDPNRQVRFATFARIRILGSLRDVKRREVPLGYRSAPWEAPVVCAMPFRPEEIGRVLTGEPDEPVGAAIEAIEEVERWLRKLPRRHAAACRQIYLHDRTPAEIARLLGCSPSRIANLHRQALGILANPWAAAVPGASAVAV